MKYYTVHYVRPDGREVACDRFGEAQRGEALRRVWETRFGKHPGQGFTNWEYPDGESYIEPGII